MILGILGPVNSQKLEFGENLEIFLCISLMVFILLCFNLASSQNNDWPGQCQDGSNQSPIKIDPTLEDFEKVKMDPFIFVNYNQTPKSGTKLINIGHTINVMFDFEKTPMVSIHHSFLRK